MQVQTHSSRWKSKLIEELFITAVADEQLMDTSDDESEDILDQLEDDLLLLCRYSDQSAGVPKSHGFYDSIFFNLDENRFKTFVRCTRKHFAVIYNKTKEHPVFTGKNSEKQLSIYFQLALVMYRIGSNGNAASVRKLVALFGVGDGGTIDRITERVFESIMSF
ncbi:hypothetical protein Bhyg_11183 [Pseudolycoriella hygida]|uniref:Uncharacterized protein n=1 Tax=Pseudolycoriella hygida TaxID=35572 RepID=A0A9Q0S016_9DIPT|nr:hypothetical protein Bhyg_11183 [Pseudolycoriella hygida]